MSHARRTRHQQLDEAQPSSPSAEHPPSTIDLHTHTNRSDGVLTPSQLASEAAAVGVRLLAITDHDTLAGYRSLTGPGSAPPPPGVQLLSGVEINSITAGLPDLWEGELHVLGLGVRADDDALEDRLSAQRQARRLRFDRTLERLRDLGLPIDAQAAALERGDEDALGRPTIGRLLMQAGFADSVEDAFRRLLARGQPAYVPRMGMGPVESIGAIRAAGGLASLAHFAEAPMRVGLLRELKEAGLDGLEVYYRSFEPQTVAAVAEVAAGLALVPTGGSDYHGDFGPYAESHARLWIPPQVGTELLERLNNLPASAPS